MRSSLSGCAPWCDRLHDFQKTAANSVEGAKPGFSPPPHHRPIRRRKEDENCRDLERALWARCREDQDRCPRLPDQQQPQARVQHCRLCLPPRNHPLRRWQLRQSGRSGSAQGGCANTAGRPVGEAEVQGGGDQRGRPPHKRRPGCPPSDHGEVLAQPAPHPPCQHHCQHHRTYPITNAARPGGCANPRRDLRRAGLICQEGRVASSEGPAPEDCRGEREKLAQGLAHV